MSELTKRYPDRDAIRAAVDRPWEDVPTPELGEGAFVRVGVMSAGDRDSFEALCDEQGKANQTANLLVRCVVDPTTSTRMFTDEDAVWLGAEKSAIWQIRAYRAAITLNTINAGALETIAKN